MLVKAICPQCQGQMEMDELQEKMKCPYCGTEVYNLAQKTELSGQVQHNVSGTVEHLGRVAYDVSGTVRHVVDRSSEPNLYISYATINYSVNMVSRIVSTGQKNSYIDGQTATFHLPKGRQEIVLKIGKKNYNRVIYIPENNEPVRINASFNGRAHIDIDQPPVTDANGQPVAVNSSIRNSALSIIAFIASLSFYFAPIGLILGIIDKIRNKPNQKHGLAVAAIIIGGIITLGLIIGMISSSSSNAVSQ